MHRVVVALVTLIGLTGIAFVAGYLFLFSAASDRAAALAPANSAFYVNVYLQPSTGQQMNLASLIGRLPGFEDDASLDDKIDQVAQNLLSDTGIDYRRQLKPWLGNQVAVAGWPGTGDVTDTVAILVAEVKDREAAEESVAELVADGGASFTARTYEGVELQVAEASAYAFIGEMLVVGTDAGALEAVVDVERGADSLADRDDFATTMDELPADHLAAVFIDLARIASATDIADQLAGFSTAGAALVAEQEGLRLSGRAPFEVDGAQPSARAESARGSEASGLVDWMPDETVAEIVLFGLRQTLEDAEAAAGSTPEGRELRGALDTIRAVAAFGLGIDLDTDVLPLLDREVGVAITGFEGDLPSGQLLLRPEDSQAAAAALGRITDRLGAVGATVREDEVQGTEITIVSLPEVGEVAYAIVDEIIIIGLGIDDVTAAIDAQAGGTSLRTAPSYERTFELAGTRAGTEAFVDVGALVELLGPAAELPDDARDILEQIGTFGFTAPSRDHHIEFHAVLTVDEARPE